MSLLGIERINRKLFANLKKHLENLRAKMTAEEAFDQALIDEICYITAWCRTVLNDTIDELDAEKKRLAKDVFADRVIADAFNEIRGDEKSFPQRVCDNMDAVSALYRAGRQGLDSFEHGMRKEWEEISKISLFKRKDFILLARRKMVSTIGELSNQRSNEPLQSRV